jgi:hypothetical protein
MMLLYMSGKVDNINKRVLNDLKNNFKDILNCYSDKQIVPIPHLNYKATTNINHGSLFLRPTKKIPSLISKKTIKSKK